MNIQSMLRIQRPIALLLLPLFLLLAIHAPARAGESLPEDVKSSNVRWVTKGDVIVINYDLMAPTDGRYQIDIIMKNDKDPSFSVAPKTVEGDIGEGPFAGANREIRWYFRQDYPRGFEGEGYYFEIRVNPVRQQSNLLYYLLGGAAVAGGAILLLAGKSSSTTNGNTDLPMPPGRP